jgi:GTP-binding protein
MDEKLPRVVIAGRPNVGKSALFNALVGRRVAIVDPTPGVTRDVVEHAVSAAGRRFLLVDTGGLGDSEDPLAQKVQRLAERSLAAADLVVLLVDVRVGIAAEDRVVARRLHALGKPVFLVANKCDTPAFDAQTGAFEALGFGPAMPVSAVERREVGELRDLLISRLSPVDPTAAAGPLRIAVLGKRNVGKSTLVNALCGTDRMLVDDVPGTTRDAVEVPFHAKGGAYAAIDAAGFRVATHMEHPIEIYAASRAREALRGCEVAFLVLDATRPVSALDKRIAREIREASKPVVIVVNKWDLMKDIRTGAYQAHLEDQLPGLEFAPIAVISAKDRRNLKALLHLARALAKQGETRVATAVLNRAVEAASKGLPGPGGPRLPKIFFTAQVASRPPTILLTVNDPKRFPSSYRRTLEQRLRETLPFTEVPIRLLFRERRGRNKPCP